MGRHQRHRMRLAVLASLCVGQGLQAGGCALRERLDAQTVTVQEVFDDLLWTGFWGPIRALGPSNED